MSSIVSLDFLHFLSDQLEQKQLARKYTGIRGKCNILENTMQDGINRVGKKLAIPFFMLVYLLYTVLL
jgi:hypothetical protein